MRKKITAQFVKTLEPTTNPYEVWDADLKGFVARVQPSGVISYYFAYRNRAGEKKRLSLGKHGVLTVFQAREAASLAAGEVALKQDPVEDKKAARAAASVASVARANERTLRQFMDREYRGWCIVNKKRGLDDLKRVERSFPAFLDMLLPEITTWHLEKWRAVRLKDTEKATAQRDLAELRAVLNRAVDWGFLSVSPFQKFKMLKFDNTRVRYLKPDEAKRLSEALANRNRRIIEERASANRWRAEREYPLLPDLAPFGDHLTPMVRLSLHTGLRRGELFALTWNAINLELRLLTVTAKSAKGSKRREIPLNSDALQVLKDWQKQTGQEVGLVFPSPRGGIFDNIQKCWSALLEEAKIEHFVWHDLRHTFASNLVMKGKDLNSVRELLGHKDMQMTLRYAHLAPEHKADVVAALVGTG